MDIIKLLAILYVIVTAGYWIHQYVRKSRIINGPWERPVTSVLTLIKTENVKLSANELEFIKALEVHVKKYMDDSFDHSHDYTHILRVVRYAIRIAKAEKMTPVAVIVTAMLHDYGDRKARVKLDGEPQKLIVELLSVMETEWCTDAIKAIAEAAISVGFGKEEAVFKRGFTSYESHKLWRIVSDADRLDAIGAIGWARAFAYGGSRNSPLYEADAQDDSKENYNARAIAGTGSTLGHFHEKLKLLYNTLKTKEGKRYGMILHNQLANFYVDAVDQIHGRVGYFNN